MLSTYAVCREILRLGKDRGIDDISPMKLIKLAYIAHGISLAVLEEPLFADKVVAWRYGPVIKSIYDAVKQYKYRTINSDLFDYADEVISPDQKEAIKCAMDIYGELTAGQLSTITHEKGSPWYRTHSWVTNLFGITIPNDDIKAHYKQILDIK